MRGLAAGLLCVGLAGCGTAREQATAPLPSALVDRPITFTTEVQPLAPAATVTTSPPPLAPVVSAPAPPTTVAPTSAARPSGRTSCRAVAHVGDSTSVGMTSPAVVRDPARRLDARYAGVGVATTRLEVSGGRSVVERLPGQQNGFEVAGRLRAAGFSGCWVIALGTCDAANVAKGSRVSRVQRVQRMMSVVGSDPVLWVDVGTRVAGGVWADAQMELWNKDLAATLSAYPNARIYGARAHTQPAWYAGDGIHYTSTGYAARAALVADALAAAFPG